MSPYLVEVYPEMLKEDARIEELQGEFVSVQEMKEQLEIQFEREKIRLEAEHNIQMEDLKTKFRMKRAQLELLEAQKLKSFM